METKNSETNALCEMPSLSKDSTIMQRSADSVRFETWSLSVINPWHRILLLLSSTIDEEREW